MLIADPSSLRRGLDDRMKKIESKGTDYYWFDQTKYPAAIGLLVDYICQCPTFIAYISKNTQVRFAPEENDDSGDNDNSNGMLNFPVVPAAGPPLFMQPSPSTAACFIPPILELAVGWMPRPHDCCYKYGVGEYHCATYAEYLRRKNAGMQVLGKPPHDSSCPVRRSTSYH